MFRIVVDKKNCYVLLTRFPLGEIGVELPVELRYLQSNSHLTIIADELVTGNDLLLLKFLVSAIKDEQKNVSLELVVPYFPYARQDRKTLPGQCFTLKVVTDIINSLNFDKVYIADPHSHVVSSLLNNCVIMNVSWAFVFENKGYDRENIPVVIAPDAGFSKKAQSINTGSQPYSVVQCLKTNGMLSDLQVVDPKGLLAAAKEAYIFDDICSRGGTFLGLAGEIRKVNPNIKLNLCVTHFEYTADLEKMFSVFENIYTTNSLPVSPEAASNNNFHVTNIYN